MTHPNLGKVLARMSQEPDLARWPILVALSPDQELVLGGDGEVTHTSVREPIQWNDRVARQFDAHPCIVCTATAGARRLNIGRSRLNDYVIPHVSVSASHAEMTFAGEDSYRLVDLKSRNGTFVEGRRLEPSEPFPLSGSSLVGFGQVMFYLLDPSMVRTLARVAHPGR
jgi:hypothetical protein